MTGGRETVIIQPPGRGVDLGLGELWRYRSLALVLAARGLKVRYRQTIIGIAWVVLQPLVLTLVFTVFWALIARATGFTGDIPRPVFLLCALAFWTPAMKVLSEGVMSILANQQLVTRVYMPRSLFPLSVALTTLVDLVFVLGALVVVLFWYGFMPSITWLVVPILVGVMYAAVIGVSLVLTALNTAYRDVQVVLPLIVQVWMFASPIIYPAELVPEPLQPLYYLNPIALVATASRWAFAGAPPPPDYAWAMGVVVSLLMLAGGYIFFRRWEPNFSDVL